jgi:hypothetical protein
MVSRPPEHSGGLADSLLCEPKALEPKMLYHEASPPRMGFVWRTRSAQKFMAARKQAGSYSAAAHFWNGFFTAAAAQAGKSGTGGPSVR